MAEVVRRRARKNRIQRTITVSYSSLQKCKERRRAMAEKMKKNAALAAVNKGKGVDRVFPWMPDRNRGVVIGYRSEMNISTTVATPLPVAIRDLVPVVGAVAITGKHHIMEDAVMIRTNLCSPPINRRRPVHFFGVFDGHGGPYVAISCKEHMHTVLADELERVDLEFPMALHANGETSTIKPPVGVAIDESVLQETWRMLFNRCFSRTEALALSKCSCGNWAFVCKCQRNLAPFSGSTAVVAVLTQEHIVVANCGDSRAVLCRGGRTVPLSFDQKPNRVDEMARIRSVGGSVFFVDTPRVEGVLAMSRAMGDRYLKPFVTSEPEVTFTRRDAEDEFIVIASDGLWDVMTSRMTCRVVRECLREPKPVTAEEEAAAGSSGPAGTLYPSRSASAAALLTRLALAKGSTDNICVVVVDLKRGAIN